MSDEQKDSLVPSARDLLAQTSARLNAERRFRFRLFELEELKHNTVSEMMLENGSIAGGLVTNRAGHHFLEVHEPINPIGPKGQIKLRAMRLREEGWNVDMNSTQHMGTLFDENGTFAIYME